MKNSWLGVDDRVVPMVMFHSVGLEGLDWEYQYISEPVWAFEDKVASLSRAGFNFITWGQLYAYLRGDVVIDLPAIVLTFDDGYLDNWVHVYPILKKYGAKGTIFVSPDFVDPSDACRPNLEDVEQGRCQHSDLQVAGFLNWEEMRHMERSGVMDIQSHATTHTWFFSGPEIVDFWKPGQKTHCWMAWNARPERKPHYLTENQWDFVECGTPVYAHDKALCVRRFFPADDIVDGMIAFVRDKGGVDFFNSADAIDQLQSKHCELLEMWKQQCRYETDSERRERTHMELKKSKQDIEHQLGKRVDFICWPGGAYDNLTLEIAREVGFKSWTLGSKDQTSVRNLPGGDARQIKRIGSAPRQLWRGRDLGWTNGQEFLYGTRFHQGSGLYKWALRGLKVLRIAGLRS